MPGTSGSTMTRWSIVVDDSPANTQPARLTAVKRIADRQRTLWGAARGVPRAPVGHDCIASPPASPLAGQCIMGRMSFAVLGDGASYEFRWRTWALLRDVLR